MPTSADQSGRIETIVIVGGGTAGWMAAIYLNRYMRRMNGKVVLVESPTIGTIGVGEATVPSLVRFIRLLNLDEKEFMRRSSGSYKLAIKFKDWVQDGVTYWHPFGRAGGDRVNGLDLFYYWLKRHSELGGKIPYAEYCVQTLLAEGGKAPLPFGGSSPVWEAGGYAYHIDASAFGDYLREIATTEGVQHLFGNVQDVALDDRGNIASLDIGGGRTLLADLFVDCTGFRGRLIEQALGDPWIDWSKHLLCNSAIAMSVPNRESIPPYTLAQAMPAGWIWNIPLSSRIGAGYVFSNAHVSSDAATDALIAQSGMRKNRGADPRLINIRVGRRTNFWFRNCVGIGLASGFIEPLESTGIHFIQRAVLMLVEYLPDRGANDAVRRAYNARMAAVYEEVRDFVVLHYLLGQRDEPFWRDARNVPLPDTLAETLAVYNETGRIDSPRLQFFLDANYFFILSGNGHLPRRLIAEADVAPASETWHMLDRVREQNRAFAARMPDHTAYIAELHRKKL